MCMAPTLMGDVVLPESAADAAEDGESCVICTESLDHGKLWTCKGCRQRLHHACLATHLKKAQQGCTCTLPGLCSCKQAPVCPFCQRLLAALAEDWRAVADEYVVEVPWAAWCVERCRC